MEERSPLLNRSFSTNPKLNRIFLVILVVALVAGTGTGYYLAVSGSPASIATPLIEEKPKTAQQDTRTFRDFAEGKIAPKPANDTGSEGSHLLIRDGGNPVAITSSVLDLNEYIGKKVKVYGETQKAIKAGWLMDVGKIDEIK